MTGCATAGTATTWLAENLSAGKTHMIEVKPQVTFEGITKNGATLTIVHDTVPSKPSSL